MHIKGEMIIGQRSLFGSAGSIHAVDPSLNREIEPAFGMATEADVAEACALADQAFDAFRDTSPEQRAVFLETIANGIVALGAELLERTASESGLPMARLEGERGRTAGQLRLFAEVLRSGNYMDVTLDSALPDRTPPRPDLRLRKIALGPVAVFGASNFPLAFSVAGGDTASALAAGCPVVVKSHNAHLGTSELIAKVIQKAAADCHMPEGVFSLLIGNGNQIGQSLVSNPSIKAVGFTGSRRGGLALVHAAAQRKEPIPVYAEMSSINPVFLMPAALQANAAGLAQSFVDSLTLGSGQFCTNPGLVIAIRGESFDSFVDAASKILRAKTPTTMLTPGIHQAYVDGVNRLAEAAGVTHLAKGKTEEHPCSAQAQLFLCDAQHFLNTASLEEEIFGPSSLFIECRNAEEMKLVAEYVEGQLTSTIHATIEDHAIARQLLPVLERKSGRILFNGFPTGVEVAYSMVHGGPYPATSDSRSTSVGASAIDRFLRPVCYQNFPADLLPEALSDANPLQLARLIDGKMTLASRS
ncbi:aldehyde dehydrogenase (NADP(+)) [Undibacterium sp. Rencai35W]|uniref:aldehyde dehydrogenase (NADP(+)) n=1 Tax=Undibacterium sp. Rencai35W TaxID=3413046 RepID=UPI003BF2FE9E